MSDGTKACPDCAERIAAAAVKCRFCGARLESGAEQAPHVAAKAQAILEGRIPEAPPGPGKITAWTIVWAVVLAALVALEVFNDPERRGVFLFFAVLGLIFLLIPLVNDLMTVAPSGRSTAKRGAQAFFGALARGHTRRAWACLSPVDRTDRPRALPTTVHLPAQTERFGFGTASSFRKWWRAASGVSSSIAGWHKRLTYKVLSVEELAPGLAVARVSVKIGGYPAWTTLTVCIGLLIAVILIMVLRKEDSFEVRKLLIERDGAWWMVNGELDDAEDRALLPLLQKR